jgi:ATP-dependent DNA helicase RecQ
MSSLRTVLFLDLELEPKGKLRDLGALLGNKELHQPHIRGLEELIKAATFICGHNLVAHDLPALRKLYPYDQFLGKPVIDTLLWSPLLFPESEYHKLVKGYLLVNPEAPNDPLADCRLCLELLKNEADAFHALDPRLCTIYRALLGERPGYNGLFALMDFRPLAGTSTVQLIRELFGATICTNAPLEQLVLDHPLELAYALALVTTRKNESILSEYVVKEFPMAQSVLEALRFTDCGSPVCRFCALHMDPRKALSERFDRLKDFRLFKGEAAPGVQERAVRAALAGSSLLAVFPTGGGKSITYQLPALMRGALMRDLTVVISPLVSLMKDQVDVLRKRHKVVNAAYISSLLSPLERDEALRQIRDGLVHLVYIAPESLRSPTIFKLLVGRNIARFVIDEAHCLSSWGQDFRVDYLYIAEFLKTLAQAKGINGPIPVSCFTATAKPQVVEDIRDYFKKRMGLELQLFITRAPRENLQYEVISVEEPDQKQVKLVDLLKENPGPAIVYVSRVKRVNELVELLQKQGFRVVGFHGRMERDEKQRNQKSFMEDQADVMVATSAFGMGVDKEDVKTIVHFNISDSLENYVQEAGRAGRSSDIEAKCFVLYHESDLSNHFRLLQQSKLNQKQIDQVWRAVKNMTKVRSKIHRSALEIAKEAGWDVEMKDLETKLKAALASLEDSGYLERRLNYTAVKATSLQLPNLGKATERINTSVQLTAAQKADCIGMLKLIATEKECRIDYLADALRMSVKKAQDTVDLLRSIGILADGKDLTAFVNLSSRSKQFVTKRLNEAMQVEEALLDIIGEGESTVSIKTLNQKLLDEDVSCTNTDLIHNILLLWESRGAIKKKRLKRQDELYTLALTRSHVDSWRLMRDRHLLADRCVRYLMGASKEQALNQQEATVNFSMLDLRKHLAREMFEQAPEMKHIEGALLYLNHIKAIQLQGGFMVYFQRLSIERKEKNTLKQYTAKDYEKLKEFYDNKVQQIHFVGEYAQKRVQSVTGALLFVNDYFTMPYEGFVRKYFPGERGKAIKRNMTDARFKEIFGRLSTEQEEIMKADGKGGSPNILIAAGPGSGKTMVLVHKIASLLLMEDVKPEQFLMLTFSKAAALEFRTRTYKLVPEYRGRLKIATFHGYCFDLLGELGDLERSDEVLRKAIDVLKDPEMNLPGVMNKSVLVLDEFQDVTKEEWDLICAIADRVPNLRVIAVGDDDQNIYEWRGSSSAQWKEFEDRFHPMHFTLVNNFRSTPQLVAFNNAIVQGIKTRIKKGTVMESRSTDIGTIRVQEYSSSYLTAPLVNDLTNQRHRGTTAVLARKNQDVLILASQLFKAGLKVRTVHGADGFQLDMLHELRQFTALLEEAGTRVGTISKENWQRTKEHFLQLHAEHPLAQDLNDILHDFEKRSEGRYEVGEWKDYARGMRMGDVVNVGEDTVLVTTMHKAKGKEFDSVFLYLVNENMAKDDDRRLIYVASTRAKKHLSVHTNTPIFRAIAAPGIEHSSNGSTYAEPAELEYVVGMKDVWLDSMIPAQRSIAKVFSGTALLVDSSFHLPGDHTALKFAKKLRDGEFHAFAKAGYVPVSGSVEYKVHWYSKNDGKEYEVILPRVRFRLK